MTTYSQSAIPEPKRLVVREQDIEDFFIEKLRSLKYEVRSDNHSKHFAFNADERFLPVYEFADEDNKKITHLDDFADRFFTAEYLAAIALQTGRAKDKAHLLQFIESGTLDAATFEMILTRHALTDRWAQFQRQFLSDSP